MQASKRKTKLILPRIQLRPTMAYVGPMAPASDLDEVPSRADLPRISSAHEEVPST